MFSFSDTAYIVKLRFVCRRHLLGSCRSDTVQWTAGAAYNERLDWECLWQPAQSQWVQSEDYRTHWRGPIKVGTWGVMHAWYCEWYSMLSLASYAI